MRALGVSQVDGDLWGKLKVALGEISPPTVALVGNLCVHMRAPCLCRSRAASKVASKEVDEMVVASTSA